MYALFFVSGVAGSVLTFVGIIKSVCKSGVVRGFPSGTYWVDICLR